MKLSTKIRISFAALILIPVLFCFIGFFGLLNFKLYTLNDTYNTTNATYEVLMNPVRMVSVICEQQVKELQEAAKNHPELYADSDWLAKINGELLDRNSFLVVVCKESLLYSGSEEAGNEEVARILSTTELSGDTDAGLYLEDYGCVITRVGYTISDDSQGYAYIVMQVNNLLPQMKKFIIDGIGAIVIALILTSSIFTLWIYRQTIKPIDKLRLATNNIKEGNLDFDMDTKGKDEFSDLYRDFDAMRRQLKQDQEDKLAADAESKVLISNISHDLKTPITAIKGYVEGLMDGVANTPEKQEKYIKIIYNKACEMDTLINELTFYSKIDSNKIPYNFTKINVNDYFGDCVEEIGIDLESRDITFGYNNEIEQDTMICADPEQLRRVIHNIVNNSIKYIQRTPARISFHLQEDADHVMIALSDNGIGIDEKDVPYIFDRFYRSDASRNSKTGGSGIGLSIVKKIVEDHGGTIICESVVNEGTTMHITLPKYKGKENAKETEEPEKLGLPEGSGL